MKYNKKIKESHEDVADLAEVLDGMMKPRPIEKKKRRREPEIEIKDEDDGEY